MIHPNNQRHAGLLAQAYALLTSTTDGLPSTTCAKQNFELVPCCRKGLPVFNQVEVTLDGLVAQGRRLAQEQQMVMNHKLSQEYLKDTGPSAPGLIGLKG